MKSWFLRLTAVFMAVVLCVAISACGKDDAGEENSLAPGQTASGEVDSVSTGNSTPLEPVLPPDEESDVQPVGGGDDTPDTLPNVSATQGKPGSTASNKATQQNNKTTVAKEPESRTVKITIPEGYNLSLIHI
mgnify:FL=1